MASPIQFGDHVGLAHPGTSGRISPKNSHDYTVFTFSGGHGLVQNGNTVTLAPQHADQYTLLTSKQQWTIKIDHNGLQSGAHITLEASGREPQQYIVYKLKNDPIEHVVVLMLENRSFFRVFGYMDPDKDKYTNTLDGKTYHSAPTDDRETPDPPHEIDFVNIQIEGGKPNGYVKAYHKYHSEQGTKGIVENDFKDVMGYTQKGFLPTLHKMADFARVCSQWYCSLSGPTWPNRMFANSGTSFNWRVTPETNLHGASPMLKYLTSWYSFHPPAPQRKSVFEILKEKHASYKVYSDNVFEFSLSFLFYPSMIDADDMDDFKSHAKKGTLPHYSFIEPNYTPSKLLQWVQNDDHPPGDPLDAQKFIADVYEALRTGPKWNNTLFVVTYDEHGGFFDPVVPPPAPVPDAVSEDKEGTFAKFGVRVPTVLVSPCVAAGIDNTVYDHTSVLKYVLEKWAPESVGHLGERVRLANTLPVLAAPRKDALPSINDADIAKGRFLRMNIPWPGSAPAIPVFKKLSIGDSAALALKDKDVVEKLKAKLVEKALAMRSPEELAAIAVTGLSLGGIADVGTVALDTAKASVAAVASAEKYAEGLLHKSVTGVGHLFGAVSGIVKPGSGSHALPEAQEVLANQIRAISLYAHKFIGDNKLAQGILWGMELTADDLAKQLLNKGKAN